jgi:hypothetical protein
MGGVVAGTACAASNPCHQSPRRARGSSAPPFLTQRGRITPMLSPRDRCFCVLVRPGAIGAPSERGSYQQFCSVIVSGGGGNRTRVLRCRNGPSPSAAGDGISGSSLAAGTGEEPQSTQMSPPAGRQDRRVSPTG